MVKLFEQNESSFSGNGVCLLDPTVCNVSETAGGSYELYIEHPIDEHGKYNLILENMIVEAPIPPTEIPEITLPETEILKVSATTDFWKKLPVYKKSNVNKTRLDVVRSRPTAFYWSSNKGYNAGDYCVYPASASGNIWLAKMYSYYCEPKSGSMYWAYQAPLEPGPGETDTYTPGVAYSPALAVNATVTKLGDYNATYYQIRDSIGRIGYILKSKVTVQTTEAEVIPKQTITTQRFRIYHIESNEESNLIKVYAKHISYDFQANKVMDCKITNTEPINALALMQGNLMEEDTRRIACQFKSTNSKNYKITADWSFKNPINALLDPDEGLVSKLKAMLVRNNDDFFILKNNKPREGITIERGVNMIGITWSRSTETVVTRVVPRCSDGGDGYLYLEHGGTWTDEAMTTWQQNNEIYVESAIAGKYPFPIIEVLDCDFCVGEKYTPTGSAEQVTMTEETCRSEMLIQAQKRFTEDACDGLEATLTVEFLLLGDTEQYKQYRGLQSVNIYDKVTIRSGTTEAEAQITKYEYDCLMGRYNSITVGTVLSFNRRVPGYRIVGGAIGYAKLSPDIINRIRTNNGSIGDSDSASPGSGASITSGVDMNSASTDGIVKKGSGQANKVWGTDANGNPDWREAAAAISVIDNLTSTSATDALSANQGKVLNEKITGISVYQPQKITEIDPDTQEEVNVTTLSTRARVIEKNGMAYVLIAALARRNIAADEPVMKGIPHSSYNLEYAIAFSGGYRGYATSDGYIKTAVAVPNWTYLYGIVVYPL